MLQTFSPNGTISLEKKAEEIICYFKRLIRHGNALHLDAKEHTLYNPFAFQLLITTQPPLDELSLEEFPQKRPS
jgi:hypothetical protein